MTVRLYGRSSPRSSSLLEENTRTGLLHRGANRPELDRVKRRVVASRAMQRQGFRSHSRHKGRRAQRVVACTMRQRRAEAARRRAVSAREAESALGASFIDTLFARPLIVFVAPQAMGQVPIMRPSCQIALSIATSG